MTAERVGRRRPLELADGGAETQRHAGQRGSEAVVEVTSQPASFLLAGRDDGHARTAEMLGQAGPSDGQPQQPGQLVDDLLIPAPEGRPVLPADDQPSDDLALLTQLDRSLMPRWAVRPRRLAATRRRSTRRSPPTRGGARAGAPRPARGGGPRRGRVRRDRRHCGRRRGGRHATPTRGGRRRTGSGRVPVRRRRRWRRCRRPATRSDQPRRPTGPARRRRRCRRP